jgi:hypothetical protein
MNYFPNVVPKEAYYRVFIPFKMQPQLLTHKLLHTQNDGTNDNIEFWQLMHYLKTVQP